MPDTPEHGDGEVTRRAEPGEAPSSDNGAASSVTGPRPAPDAATSGAYGAAATGPHGGAAGGPYGAAESPGHGVEDSSWPPQVTGPYAAPPGYGPTAAYGPPGFAPAAAYGPPGGPGSGPPGFHTAPRPGVIPLRPLGLGELFGGAVAYIRGNLGSTVLPAAVVAVVVQLGQLLVQLLVRRPTVPRSPAAVLRSLTTLGAATFPVSLVSLVLGAVLTALLVAVMRGAMVGRRTPLGEAWRATRSRVPGLIGLSLVIGLMIGIAAIVGVGVTIGVALAVRGAAGALLAFVFALATAAVVAFLAILLSLAPAAYVIEDVGVGAALRRSAGLVRGSWWRIFGVLLLAGIVIGVVAVVLLLIFGAAAVLTSPATLTASPIALLVSAVVTVALSAFFTPFLTGLITLIYADQRIRRERFDLQLALWAQGAPPF